MADVAAGLKPEGAAYWSRDLSDEDQPPVYVPGVSAERNFRTRHLLRAQKTEAKAKVPVTPIPSPMDALKNAGGKAGQQVPDKGGMKSASLKDLCPEDKRRIANLIKELARVSEEKEVTEERLRAEQEVFEKKIRQLEEQNEFIIKEREALQQQYRECQELLSLYQKYLSEQQEKLTHSLSELEAAKQKEQQMSTQRGHCQLAPPSDLDGSYLGLSRPQTLYKNHHMTSKSPTVVTSTQSCRNSCVFGTRTQGSQKEDRNGFLLENGLRSKCNNVISPTNLKLPLHFKRTPEGEKKKNTCPLQSCSFHKKLGSPHHDPFQDGCHIQERYSESSEYFCSSHPPGLNGNEDSQLQRTSHGKRFSEEKRKQLLLQKMELEIEKERLQNLLAKQEAKLLLQQQQLQRSRLDYHQFKAHTSTSEDLLMDEVLMRPGCSAPAMNGICGGLSSPKMNCEGCILKTPFGKSCKAPEIHEGIHSGKRNVGFRNDVDDGVHWECSKKEPIKPKRGITSNSGKDAATSPGLTGNRKELVTAATSPIQQGTWRYETSLLDLVKAISPGQQHPCGETYYLNEEIKSQNRSWRKPGWCQRPSSARNGAADLEESLILKEIFFI